MRGWLASVDEGQVNERQIARKRLEAKRKFRTDVAPITDADIDKEMRPHR